MGRPGVTCVSCVGCVERGGVVRVLVAPRVVQFASHPAALGFWSISAGNGKLCPSRVENMPNLQGPELGVGGALVGHWRQLLGIGGALAGHWRLVLVGTGWALVGIGGHWRALARAGAHTQRCAGVCGLHAKISFFVCKSASSAVP